MDLFALVFYLVILSYPLTAKFLAIAFTFVLWDPINLFLKVVESNVGHSICFIVVQFIANHISYHAIFMNCRTCIFLCAGMARCFMNLLGNLGKHQDRKTKNDLIFEYKCLEICFTIVKPLANKIIAGWLVICFLFLATQFKFLVLGLTKSYTILYVIASLALIGSLVSTLVVFKIGIYLTHTSSKILRNWDTKSFMFKENLVIKTVRRTETNKRVRSCRPIILQCGNFAAISESTKIMF